MRDTHSLESIKKETSQSRERKQTNKALTAWRCEQRENENENIGREQVNRGNTPTRKHRRVTDQDMGRMQVSDGHSLSEEHRRGRIRT